MTSTEETSAQPAVGAWELWRQDDNGNRFRIGSFDTEAQAGVEQRRFEALAHKQIYWVEPREDDDRG
ncbi:MAG TPA: SPOR domain-containing protein [Longimicrobium sp.]|nr:SPOR domain-containing protein [Longimicrobium sp.]